MQTCLPGTATPQHEDPQRAPPSQRCDPPARGPLLQEEWASDSEGLLFAGRSLGRGPWSCCGDNSRLRSALSTSPCRWASAPGSRTRPCHLALGEGGVSTFSRILAGSQVCASPISRAGPIAHAQTRLEPTREAPSPAGSSGTGIKACQPADPVPASGCPGPVPARWRQPGAI